LDLQQIYHRDHELHRIYHHLFRVKVEESFDFVYHFLFPFHGNGNEIWNVKVIDDGVIVDRLDLVNVSESESGIGVDAVVAE
jgi:hypothetical protein